MDTENKYILVFYTMSITNVPNNILKLREEWYDAVIKSGWKERDDKPPKWWVQHPDGTYKIEILKWIRRDKRHMIVQNGNGDIDVDVNYLATKRSQVVSVPDRKIKQKNPLKDLFNAISEYIDANPDDFDIPQQPTPVRPQSQASSRASSRSSTPQNEINEMPKQFRKLTVWTPLEHNKNVLMKITEYVKADNRATITFGITVKKVGADISTILGTMEDVKLDMSPKELIKLCDKHFDEVDSDVVASTDAQLRQHIPTEKITEVYNSVRKALKSENGGIVNIYDDKMNVVVSVDDEVMAIYELNNLLKSDVELGTKNATYIGSKYSMVALKGGKNPAFETSFIQRIKGMNLKTEKDKLITLAEMIQKGSISSDDVKNLASDALSYQVDEPTVDMKAKHYSKNDILKLKRYARKLKLYEFTRI